MPKVLHIVDTYLNITETFIYTFIKQSKKVGDVNVACFKVNNLSKFPVNGFKLIDLCSKKRLIDKVYYLYCKFTRKNYWEKSLELIFDNETPDIVHCHFGTTALIVLKLMQKTKSSFIVSFYGYDATEKPLSSLEYRESLIELWKQVKCILVEGPSLREKILLLGAPMDKIIISPILIDVNSYALNKNKSISIGIEFLIIGRFVEKKGIHIFLEAIGQLYNEVSLQFTVDIIGDGPLMPKYAEIIKKHNIGPFIKFHGYKSLDEIKECLKNYEVIVHPSLSAKNGDSEGGAPTILLEAQASGIPIISTYHADIPFIMPYNDFLAEENDVSSLKNSILKYLSSRGNNLDKIQIGRKYVKDFHDIESNIYVDILRKII